jgi:hypothetical protein
VPSEGSPHAIFRMRSSARVLPSGKWEHPADRSSNSSMRTSAQTAGHERQACALLSSQVMAILLSTSPRARASRVLPLLPLALVVAFCGGNPAIRTTAEDPTRIEARQLWMEPRDLESRDLFHGPGGPALAPDPSTPYQFVDVDDTGFSPGYDVRDSRGIEWGVKLGIEAQPEVVSSRVLWAIGYHQPPTYLLTTWQLTGRQSGAQGMARFRPEWPDRKVVADWSWYENPFVTTQPFKGLIVVNLLLNNWDWKTSNNKVYEARNEDSGPHRLYIVRDLGASLGRTTFPRFLSWTPFRFGKQGTRNDIGGFERQPFIKGVDGRRVRFDYRGTNGRLVDTVTVDDVLWTCRLMSRISDRQWRDVFRAAGYAEADQQRYITKLKSKMQEGLALASIVPKT